MNLSSSEGGGSEEPTQARLLIVNQGALGGPGSVQRRLCDQLAQHAPHSIRLKQGNINANIHFLASDSYMSTAFTCFGEEDVLLACNREALAERLSEASRSFRRCFALALFHSRFGYTKLVEFQSLYQESGPKMLIAGDVQTAVRLVLGLTYNQTKQGNELRDAKILQLKRRAMERQAAIEVLESIPGITPGDGSLLLDCLGSVVAVTQASAQEIIRSTPCSSQTAHAVQALFEEPDDGGVEERREELLEQEKQRQLQQQQLHHRGEDFLMMHRRTGELQHRDAFQR